MRSVLYMLAVSVGVNFASASFAQAPRAAASPAIEADLRREADALSVQGLQLAGEPHLATTSPNTTRRFALDLRGGIDMAIIAACGDGCGRIAIGLLDGSGAKLVETPDNERIAILAGTPPSDGEYIVEIRSPDCATPTCRFGLQQLAMASPAQPPPIVTDSTDLLRFMVSADELARARGLVAPQMTGRIRAVAMDQCPQIERLQFEARGPAIKALKFETARLTGWARLIELDGSGAPLLCGGEGRCAGLSLAYAAAHRVVRGDELSAWIIDIGDLSSPTGSLLWRTSEGAGKLSVIERSAFKERFADAAGLADALLAVEQQRCVADGGSAREDWAESYEGGVQVRGSACVRSDKARREHALVVRSHRENFEIAAFAASDAKPETAASDARAYAIASVSSR